MKTANKIIIGSFIGLILVSFLLVVLLMPTEQKIVKEYPNLSSDNVYEEIDAQGFLNKVNSKQSFITIFGFPTCPWCQSIIPVLNDVAKAEGLDVVYYIYLKDMRDNTKSPQHQDYLKIYDLLKENDGIDKEKERVNAPTIVVVKDGNVVASHLDTVPSHQIENGVLPPLNGQQLAELKKIIKGLIKKLK